MSHTHSHRHFDVEFDHPHVIYALRTATSGQSPEELIPSAAAINPGFTRRSSMSPNRRSFNLGQMIPLEAQWVWQIERGYVRTSTWNDLGDWMTLGIWGPNDLVGQPLSAIEPYQIDCLMPVEACKVPWSSIQQDALMHHLQRIEELLAISRTPKVPRRLMEVLQWLAQRFGEPTDEGWVIDFRLTHQALAELVGTTRVSVTRLLKQLEEDQQLVRLQGHRILIKIVSYRTIG